MSHLPYVGNGPYCYANAFAMMLGDRSPSTAVIEVATGGPFGMQLVGGALPFFDAYGWNPEMGFEPAPHRDRLDLDGHQRRGCREALARLTEAVAAGPVWVGPVEMGLFRHQPEMTGPIGADHYVWFWRSIPSWVLIHDPHGYPYATVPTDEFLAAWRADTVSYGEPYTMRTGFRKVADVSDVDAIRSVIPAAIGYLAMRAGGDMPPGKSRQRRSGRPPGRADRGRCRRRVARAADLLRAAGRCAAPR